MIGLPPSPGFPKLGTLHFGRARPIHCIVWSVSKARGLAYVSRPQDVPDIFKLAIDGEAKLRSCVVYARDEMSILFRVAKEAAD